MAANITFRVGVVLPAAGCGERMKLATPKQFCDVNGRPLICYTVDCFHRLPWIQNIVISTSKSHMDLLRDLMGMYNFDKVTLVEGGTTRHRSICAAVRALQQVSANLEVVVIHDAVRPFVSSDVMERIAVAAYHHGAAGVCRPLVSTVIARDADQRLTESLDRSQYFNSEMPQAFQVAVISSAYDQCTRDDFDHGTECLLLAMKYSGVHAKILDGNSDLWKVTYKKDLFSAEAVIKERMTRVQVVHGERWPALEHSLITQLQALHFQVVQESNPDSGDHTTPSGGAPLATNTANTFVVLHMDLNTPDQDGISVNEDLNNVSRDAKANCTDVAAANDDQSHASGDGEVKRRDPNRHVARGEKDVSIPNSESGHKAVNCANKDVNNLNTTGCVANKDMKDLNATACVVNRDVKDLSTNACVTGKAVNSLNASVVVRNKDVNFIMNKLMLAQNKCLSSRPSLQLINRTFVHVFVVATETKSLELHAELSRVVMQLSRDCQEKDVVVYGVLATKAASAEKVGQMTASVIQRGHAHFSGQLFLVG